MRWVLATALVAAAAAAAPAAAATRGPCLPGDPGSPTCTLWSGKVVFLADGDTMNVQVRGVGFARIRLGGINATELTRYSKYADRRRGECHGVEATARVQRLLRRARWRVRLAAQDPASRSGSRLRRAVFVRLGGRWVDVAGTLVAEGHALWLPSHEEWAFNGGYASAAVAAAARGANLWDPDACGPVPSPGVTPRLDVVWDAPGNDQADPAGEELRITNPSSSPLPLGGWWVRDSSAQRFRLPAGTVVGPGDTLRVHVGRGSDTATDVFWGLPRPIFENVSGPPRYEGDGGYLFDPRGNLRAHDQYGGGRHPRKTTELHRAATSRLHVLDDPVPDRRFENVGHTTILRVDMK